MTLILSAPICPTCSARVQAEAVLIVRPEPQQPERALGRLFAYHPQCLPVALYQSVIDDLKLAS